MTNNRGTLLSLEDFPRRKTTLSPITWMSDDVLARSELYRQVNRPLFEAIGAFAFCLSRSVITRDTAHDLDSTSFHILNVSRRISFVRILDIRPANKYGGTAAVSVLVRAKPAGRQVDSGHCRGLAAPCSPRVPRSMKRAYLTKSPVRN